MQESPISVVATGYRFPFFLVITNGKNISVGYGKKRDRGEKNEKDFVFSCGSGWICFNGMRE
jgi:hypothetical protein